MKPFFIIFFIFGLVNISAKAQKKFPATLLWRISGKNLQKPSYLFGTMHVRESNMFYFGDSVYQAIENVELFATEIEDDIYLDHIGKKLIENSLLETDSDVDESKLELADAITPDANTGKPAPGKEGKFKIKEYLEILKESARNRKGNNQKLMPVIIDAYLNKIAMDKKKKISGLEDPEDNEDMMDVVTKKTNENVSRLDLLRINNGAMEAYYLGQDLDGIHKLMGTVFSKEALHYLLYKRNVKMAHRIDSFLQNTSAFFAVGSGHLAGDSGLFVLLRQKGYTINPVFSSKKLPPMPFDVRNEIWFNTYATDSSCVVQVPKKTYPIILNELEGALHFTQDIGSRVSYFFMEIIAETKDKNATELKKSMQILLENKGYTIEETRTVKGSLQYEFICTSEENIYRIKALTNKNNYYFLIAGADEGDKRYLEEPDVERFFKSFQWIQPSEAKLQWRIFQNNDFSFQANMPVVVKKFLKNSPKNSNASFTIIGTDLQNNNSYKIVAYKTNPGFYYAKDTGFFTEYYQTLLTENTNEYTLDTTGFYFQEKISMQYIQRKENQIKSMHWVISDGNKLYYIIANAYTDTSGFGNFFNSIAIYRNPFPVWKMHLLPKDNLLVYVPDTFKNDEDDPDTGQEKPDNISGTWLSYDSSNAINYYVYKKKINPFKTYSNDSIFFEDNISTYFDFKDSIIFKKTTGTENDLLVEVLLKKYETLNQFTKFKFFTNGDTIYGLNMIGNRKFLQTATVDSFFNNYRFMLKHPNTYKKDKTVALLKALQSDHYPDIVLAYEALDNIVVGALNQKMLMEAILKNNKSDTGSYASADFKLANLLIKNADSSLPDFVRTNYLKQKSDSVKMKLLYLLANTKTDTSYLLLQQYLNKPFPFSTDEFDYTNSLRDSIALTAKYLLPVIPNILQPSGDPLLAIGILDKMIDSQFVTDKIYLSYSKAVQALANEQLRQYKKDPYYYEAYTEEMLRALAVLNTRESKKTLLEFSGLEERNIVHFWVLKALVKAKQPIPKKLLQELCTKDDYRLDVWDFLKESKMEAMFLKEYATQEQFAKAYVYTSAMEESETAIENIDFYKRVLKKIEDKEVYFYLFKIKFEDDENYMAAWCGVFEKDIQKFEPRKDVRFYMDFENSFDFKTLQTNFDAWFASEFR